MKNIDKKKIIKIILIIVILLGISYAGFRIYNYYSNRKEIPNTITLYKEVDDFQFMDANMFYNPEEKISYFDVVVRNTGSKNYDNIAGIKVKFLNKYGKEINYMLYAMEEPVFYGNTTIMVSLFKEVKINFSDVYELDYEILYKD